MLKCDIYKAFEKDICDLERVEKKYFSDPWSENSFLSTIKSDFSEIYICKNGNDFIGYIVISIMNNESINIDNICIENDFRKKGYASYLINYIINKYDYIKCFQLEVRESNLCAINLYKKIGFYQNGSRPKYYINPVETAILMQKDL